MNQQNLPLSYERPAGVEIGGRWHVIDWNSFEQAEQQTSDTVFVDPHGPIHHPWECEHYDAFLQSLQRKEQSGFYASVYTPDQLEAARKCVEAQREEGNEDK